MSNLYLMKKNNYSEENTSDNGDFRSFILQPFQLESEQIYVYRFVTYQNRES